MKNMVGPTNLRNIGRHPSESNGFNVSASKPEMCQFEVRLGDFVREGQLTAQMASNKTKVGELVVELKRCPEQNRYPTSAGATRRPSNYVNRRSLLNRGNDESYLNDLNESDLSVSTEKFRISAKDQLHFLVNDFSKRCRLRKSEVKAELLAFKRAVLRDYSNRLMKFSMSFDNLPIRQAPRNVSRNSHVNGAVAGVPNCHSKPQEMKRASVTETLPKVSAVQSVEPTADSRVANAISPHSRTIPVPSAHEVHSSAPLSVSGRASQPSGIQSTTKASRLAISSAAHSQLMDQFISLSPPIQSATGGVSLAVARKTLKRPINALNLDSNVFQPASSNSASSIPPTAGVHPMIRPVIVKKRPVVPFSSFSITTAAEVSRMDQANCSVNAVVNRFSSLSQILQQPIAPVGSVSSTNEQQRSSRAALGIPQIVSVTTLADPLEIPVSLNNDVVCHEGETESEMSSCSTIMAGSITDGTIPDPSNNLSNRSISSHETGTTTIAAAEESSSNVATNPSANTADSAIDVEMSGEDEQTPSIKKVKQEPIFEPNEGAANLEPNSKAIATSDPVASSAVLSPPQRSGKQVSNVVANRIIQPTNEKPFRCWICGFGFSEEPEIDLHLRTYYQNSSDTSHTPESITPLFNLDNPKILIFCETGSILLKCLFCEQIHKKLSLFLIHNMMHCPDNGTRKPTRLLPANTSNITVFDVIKTVDSNDVPANDQRVIIAGANEISICGQIECGALLNQFDHRPHRRCLTSSSSDPTRIKCKYADCSFEGDKKNLITHYTMSHFIFLSNVNLQREEIEFLNVNRSPNVPRLIYAPAAEVQSNLEDVMQNNVQQNSQFPNQTTSNNTAMGYRRDTILQGTVPAPANISGNNANVTPNSITSTGPQQLNSHIRPSMAQHTSAPQQPRVTNYNQFYVNNAQPNQYDNANMGYSASALSMENNSAANGLVASNGGSGLGSPVTTSTTSNVMYQRYPRVTNDSLVTSGHINYQNPRNNMYVQQPSYVQPQQPQVMPSAVPQQRLVYQNRTTHSHQRTQPFNIQTGGPFRNFRPLVSTQQSTQTIQQPPLVQPQTHNMQQAFGPQVQTSGQSIQRPPPSNSGNFQYLNWS